MVSQRLPLIIHHTEECLPIKQGCAAGKEKEQQCPLPLHALEGPEPEADRWGATRLVWITL